MTTGFWQPTNQMIRQLCTRCPECEAKFNMTTTVPIMSTTCGHSMCARCIQTIVLQERQLYPQRHNLCRLNCAVPGCGAVNAYTMGKESVRINLLALSMLQEEEDY